MDLAAWRFRISGLVVKKSHWDWEEFLKLCLASECSRTSIA